MSPEQLPEYKITKTSFLLFLECPREFWLSFFHPELISKTIDPSGQVRIKQGYEVQRFAKQVVQSTKKVSEQPGLFDDLGIRSEYSVTFNNFSAKIDILDGTNLIEVKSGKHIPADHKNKARLEKRKRNLYDIAYQLFVARRSGANVERATLVTINGDYIREDDLDIAELLHFEDVTSEVEELQREIEALATAAISVLEAGPREDLEGLCKAKLKCPYFEYSRPDLPEFTIYDIPGLRGARFEKLKATGALDIREIPEDADLTPKQKTWIENTIDPPTSTIIKKDYLIEAFDRLHYPLYFLDYETFNPAVPQFKGMKPYEQMTFQFSLHIRAERGGDLVHYEFVSDGVGEFQRDLLDKLSSHIGETGSVISWNDSFEIGRNNELGNLYPEYAEFVESVNSRMFDLGKEVFAKGLYSDPQIKGWSLKRVQPELVPEMSYGDLDIGDGANASAKWFLDVFLGSDQKEETLEALRKYCEQDTLVMVRILDELKAMVGE